MRGHEFYNPDQPVCLEQLMGANGEVEMSTQFLMATQVEWIKNPFRKKAKNVADEWTPNSREERSLIDDINYPLSELNGDPYALNPIIDQRRYTDALREVEKAAGLAGDPSIVADFTTNVNAHNQTAVAINQVKARLNELGAGFTALRSQGRTSGEQFDGAQAVREKIMNNVNRRLEKIDAQIQAEKKRLGELLATHMEIEANFPEVGVRHTHDARVVACHTGFSGEVDQTMDAFFNVTRTYYNPNPNVAEKQRQGGDGESGVRFNFRR